METTFSNTPRVKNVPFSKRVGDNLLERDVGGHVCVRIGYYSPSQVLARRRYGMVMCKAVVEVRRSFLIND